MTENSVCPGLKVRGGFFSLLVGLASDRTVLDLDFGGGYMTTHLSKFMDVFTKK